MVTQLALLHEASAEQGPMVNAFQLKLAAAGLGCDISRMLLDFGIGIVSGTFVSLSGCHNNDASMAHR